MGNRCKIKTNAFPFVQHEMGGTKMLFFSFRR